ncbi:MAG: insulinase family protein [Flavobacteriaceae bacterium]
MRKLNKLWLFLLALPFATAAQEFKLDSKIPLDPSVRSGKLKNGLTYYIKHNKKPENKVDLRLVINAGSILEDDDQQGLAHFMEHMCFNGTKNFPKNELVDYLQSIGVKFGQHLNAYTSFDETVYFLPIPSDDKEKLDKGFLILEDWAFNTVLTPEEIDKERGVVLEEYRIGLGAQRRMMGQFLPKVMYQSHYANRLPIGQKEILENFKHEALVRFYKDWYRPNLMSIIVVGDIDVDAIEKKIIKNFSKYKNPKKERPRKMYDVPNHKETFVAVESDKEASSSQVQLYYKDKTDAKPMLTIRDYKDNLIKGLFSSMLNNRLNELTNSPVPPFTYGYSYHGSTWARTKEAFQSFAMTQEDKQLSALNVLVRENERVRKYGFTQSELDRVKTEFLAYYDKFYNDRDKTNSSSFVSQFQSHFLEQTPTPGIEWEYKALQHFLSQITLEEINGLINDYIKDENRVVVLTGPEKEGLVKPTEEEVLEALKVNQAEITPYEDSEIAESLVRGVIKAGKITKRETNDKLETTTLTLSNGAKVVHKKTDFKNDEIVFSAVSFGGTNLYSDEEYLKTQWANSALTEAGFSGLSKNDIEKFMTGKIASVYPFIGNVTEGLSGSTTPKDVEYLFQMVYAYFTDLNYDTDAFEGYKQKQSAFFDNMMSNPNMYFQKELYTYLAQKNPRFSEILPDAKAWERTDYQLAYNKYKERFADASDFVFYFVGNVEKEKIETLSEQYLASLPSLNRKDQIKDIGYRMLSGEHKKVVHKGSDPKSNVTIMFYGDTQYDPKEALSMQALGEVLTIKLIEELRENKSGVYGASARGSMSKIPYGSYSFNISFPCGPENVESLIASALRELQKIIDNGPEEKDLAKFKEGELLDYKEDVKTNSFWLNNLRSAYTNGTNPERILAFEERVKALTAKDVQAVAKKYTSKDKVIGVLMPEE